jgi:hypothetical protein
MRRSFPSCLLVACRCVQIQWRGGDVKDSYIMLCKTDTWGWEGRESVIDCWCAATLKDLDCFFPVPAQQRTKWQFEFTTPLPDSAAYLLSSMTSIVYTLEYWPKQLLLRLSMYLSSWNHTNDAYDLIISPYCTTTHQTNYFLHIVFNSPQAIKAELQVHAFFPDWTFSFPWYVHMCRLAREQPCWWQRSCQTNKLYMKGLETS